MEREEDSGFANFRGLVYHRSLRKLCVRFEIDSRSIAF